MDMNAVFGQQEATEPVVAEDTVKVSEKKQRERDMKAALKETVTTNPDYAKRLHRLSDSIKVVNTLGFGTSGNIVVDKTKSTADNKVLKPTSTICGYKIQNIGSEPIEYTTEVYSQDESGKYVGQVVKKQLAPGETINLTRQYTTMLCSIPEISFTLANGKIVASPKKGAKTLKEELSAYYFSFNKNEDGITPQVNDDEIKLSVDDADGKVKDEYVETFGYLNNPKEGRTRGSKGAKFTTQDLAANFIYKLIQDNGIM